MRAPRYRRKIHRAVRLIVTERVIALCTLSALRYFGEVPNDRLAQRLRDMEGVLRFTTQDNFPSAWIPGLHCIAVQDRQALFRQGGPVLRGKPMVQLHKVMASGDRQRMTDQQCLQVFLDTLLTVKTNCADGTVFFQRKSVLCILVILLSLFNPLPYQMKLLRPHHRAPSLPGQPDTGCGLPRLYISQIPPALPRFIHTSIPFFWLFWILAQVSRRPTVRLKTSVPPVLSGSTQK